MPQQSEVEYLDVVNENDEYTGVFREKHLVHQNNEFHRTAHIWLMNRNRELLIQKRSMTKESLPGYWDISCAGHIRHGETVLQGALRELREELGVTASQNDLTYITKVIYEGTNNHEFGYVFLVETDLNTDDFIFTDEEVEKVEYVYYEDLEKMIRNGRKDLLVHGNEEEILFSYIRENY